jgi:hypothetical protein
MRLQSCFSLSTGCHLATAKNSLTKDSTMKKKYAFLPVMAALSLVLAATVYAGIIEEFVALERAYVPALARSNRLIRRRVSSSNPSHRERWPARPIFSRRKRGFTYEDKSHDGQ